MRSENEKKFSRILEKRESRWSLSGRGNGEGKETVTGEEEKRR